MSKYWKFLITSLLLFNLSQFAFAIEPTFPARPIRMVVPFAPGGGSDVVARVIANKMYEGSGQTVIVDNRPGAAGLVGTQLVRSSSPDGYTLLLADTPFAANPFLYTKAGYDPVRSFAPISQVATTPLLLVTHLTFSPGNVRELITLAKSQPSKINMGTAGPGSISHFAEVLFCNMAGINVSLIPYKGAGPALADLMGGQIQSMIATAPSVIPLIKSGKIRVLAVTSHARSQLVPEVPTMEESGVKGYSVSNWYMLLTPFGTPANVLSELHREVVKTLKHRDVIDRFNGAIIESALSASPLDAREMVLSENKKWGKVIKDAGLKMDQ